MLQFLYGVNTQHYILVNFKKGITLLHCRQNTKQLKRAAISSETQTAPAAPARLNAEQHQMAWTQSSSSN
jgi:hypothetical protein